MITNFDFTITKDTENCGSFSVPNIVDITGDYIIPTTQTDDIDAISLIRYNVHSCNDDIGAYTTVTAFPLETYDDDISGITFTGYSDGVYFIELEVTYTTDSVEYTVVTRQCVFVNCDISCTISNCILDNEVGWADMILLLKGMELAEQCNNCEQLCFFYNMYLNLINNECNC